MTALFPTFGNLLQRAKRLLATDLTPIWQKIEATLEADEQRYINESCVRGLEDFSPFGKTLF